MSRRSRHPIHPGHIPCVSCSSCSLGSHFTGPHRHHSRATTQCHIIMPRHAPAAALHPPRLATCKGAPALSTLLARGRQLDVNTCLMDNNLETSRSTAFKNSPLLWPSRVEGRPNSRNTLSISVLAAGVALRSAVGIAIRKWEHGQTVVLRLATLVA